MQRNHSTQRPASSLHISTHEKYLFELNAYPLLNFEVGLKNMNADKALFRTILDTVIKQEFPAEKAAFIRAHAQKDWGSIEKLAHKMKGGAMYTGLSKLQYACRHFEEYYQRAQTQLLENLYQQIMLTLDDTQREIETWIKSHDQQNTQRFAE